MSDIIRFPYNKSFAYSAIVLLSILFFIFLLRTFQFSDPKQIEVISLFDILFIILIGFITWKYLIPAAKGKTALELNENSIVDNVRKRIVRWDNIQGVRYVRLWGTLTSGVAIDLIDESSFFAEKNSFHRFLARLIKASYKSPFIIPLQYVSGEGGQIFQTVRIYWEQKKSA